MSVTDDSGDYTTDNASVFTMTVFDSSTNKAATVIRDDTNYVFGSIKDDDGTDIITDTSGNTKYYATMASGLYKVIILQHLKYRNNKRRLREK